MNRAVYLLLAAGLLLGAAASATADVTVSASQSATVAGNTVECSVAFTVTTPTDGSAPTVSDPAPTCTGV